MPSRSDIISELRPEGSRSCGIQKTSRAKGAAQTIARRGSGMSGRLPAARGPPALTLLYPQAEGRGNVLASKRSEAQPKTLLVFCRLKDPCWIRIFGN